MNISRFSFLISLVAALFGPRRKVSAAISEDAPTEKRLRHRVVFPDFVPFTRRELNKWIADWSNRFPGVPILYMDISARLASEIPSWGRSEEEIAAGMILSGLPFPQRIITENNEPGWNPDERRYIIFTS